MMAKSGGLELCVELPPPPQPVMARIAAIATTAGHARRRAESRVRELTAGSYGRAGRAGLVRNETPTHASPTPCLNFSERVFNGAFPLCPEGSHREPRTSRQQLGHPHGER